MKRTKKMFAGVLMTVLFANTVLPGLDVQAAESKESQKTDAQVVEAQESEAQESAAQEVEVQEPEVQELDAQGVEVQEPEVQESVAQTTEKEGYKSLTEIDLGELESAGEANTAVYNRYAASKWDKCSTKYFYNQLSQSQKSVYDSAYNACMTYLTTNVDASSYNSSTGFSTPIYTPAGMSKADAKKVLTLFTTNNPQFYFINEYYGTGYYGSQNYILIGMYPEWVSGSTRATVTSSVSAKMDTWIAAVNAEKTMLDKERKAHDLVAQNTEYAYANYDQSCAGVFLEGKAVCAGYAETFALLCNSAGITTLSVTSSDHEWNVVQLYGGWYNVDCTWDDRDSDSTIYYDYFNVSDTKVADGHHGIESAWDGFTIPNCTSNSVIHNASYWQGEKYYVNDKPQSNVFLAPVRENSNTKWYYFAYSTDDANAGTSAYDIRTGWLRDEKTGKLHFAFPENGLLMANMWSSDHKYYFADLDLAIGKFDANDGYTYFSYSENATINGQKVTGVVQSGWVMDEQTGDLYFCFPENCRMARGIQLGRYIFADSGKCLNP